MTNKEKNFFELIALISILFVYLFLASFDIRLPGVDNDGANFGLQCYDIFKGGGIHLMLTPREGILDAYLVAPFFFFFEDPVLAIRYGCIFINAVAIFIFYFFARNFLRSRLLGFATMLLIVSHPSFIDATRHASWSNFNIFLPISIALLAFQQWYEKDKISYFLVGIFFLGGAVGTRIHSIWIINCLVLYFFLFRSYRRFYGRKKLLLVSILALIIFLLGAWNIVLYNIIGKISLVKIQEAFLHSYGYFGTVNGILFDFERGIAPISLKQNIAAAFENFLFVLNGFLLPLWSGSRYVSGLLSTKLFFISLSIFSLGLFFNNKGSRVSFKKLVFLLVISFFVFLQSLFTPYLHPSFHFYIIIPFAQLMVVASFSKVLELVKNNFILKCLFIMMFIFVITQNIMCWHREKLDFRLTGGGGYHGDAMYRLVEWLEENHELRPVEVTWGFGACIKLLSKNRISTIDFQSQTDIFHVNEYMKKKNDLFYFKDKWKEVFRDKKNIFLVYQQSMDLNSEIYLLFLRLAREFDLKPRVVQKFYTRDDVLIYNVFQME